MSMRRLGSLNWPYVFLAIAIAGAFLFAGFKMVHDSRMLVAQRNEVFREVRTQKQLEDERKRLLNRLAPLMAATRLKLESLELGLTVPDERHVIVIEPEAK